MIMTNRKHILSSLLGLFLALGTIAQQVPQVHVQGAMKDMGDTYDLKMDLDTLTERSHLYGMGPYDRMKGEITIVDGIPHYASAFVEGEYHIGQSWGLQSPFFVYANVPEWEMFEMKGPINSVAELQTKVATLAKDRGYDLGLPFAFRITGTFEGLTAHIVTPRSPDVEGYREGVKSQKFSFDHIGGEIVGFYSENHQGIFTGTNSFVHVHFLKDDKTFMGHLDAIGSGMGTFQLYLPKRNTGSHSEIRVNDTDFSKGRLGHIQTIGLEDLVKFHGHLCDGLVVGHLGLQQALMSLYPDGTVDRTNTRVVSRSSPCLTDAAMYLTGGRYPYDTFYVSDTIDGLFLVQRIDTGKTVSVHLNQGVKPEIIDEMGQKAIKGELGACELETLRQLEDDFSKKLLDSNPSELYTLKEIKDFTWSPVLKNDFLKTDILNKDKEGCPK